MESTVLGYGTVRVQNQVRDKHHKVGEKERKGGCSALRITSRLGPFLHADSGIREPFSSL